MSIMTTRQRKESNMEPLTIEQLKNFPKREGVIGKHIWVYDLAKKLYIAAIVDTLYKTEGGIEIAAVWSAFQSDKQREMIRPFFLERDYGVTWLAFETLPV